MKKNKYWFSLVEIIIATSIITIWVFWIYKLFSSNMRIIWENEDYKTQINMQIPLIECLKNIWYNSLNTYSSWDYFSINFWNDNMWCFTWTYDSNYTFTWVNMDNLDYHLYLKITWKDSEKISIEPNIYSETLWELYKTSWENNIDIYK